MKKVNNSITAKYMMFALAVAYDSAMHPIISDDLNKISRRLLSITDDLGNVVDYNINGLGMILSVTNSRYDSQSKNTYIFKCEYSYDSPRFLTTSVNNTYQISNTQYPQNNIGPYTIVDSRYEYNALGMRTSKEIWEDANKDGSASLTRTEDYEYDNLNRLTSADYGDGQVQGYTFDAMGNRMTKTDNVIGNDTYTYNNANMLLTRNSNNYTNDDNGNTLTGGGRTNTWDVQNRLVSCTYGGGTTTYTYGADGLRRSLTTNGVTTHYVLDGQSVALEWKDSDSDGIMDSNETISYLNGPRGAEYRKDNATGQVRWYLYDGLGSVVGEMDDSGNVTSSKKFDVYGAVRATTGTPTTKHGFVGSLGHVSEDNTGLIYMRARYMDPTLGRFISEDPAFDGVNWYAYCVNNPVNFVDESGKMPDTIVGLVAFITSIFALDIIGILITAVGICKKNIPMMIAGVLVGAVGAYLTYTQLDAACAALGVLLNKQRDGFEEYFLPSINKIKESGNWIDKISVHQVELIGYLLLED